LAHKERLRITREYPSTWNRVRDALRSITLGPYNSKDPALARLFNQGGSSSGIAVNETTALNYSAVWAAVSIISGDIASLPLPLYKRLKGGGKERYTEHTLYKILHDAPNPEMSSMVFRETLQAHVLLWGNAYAEIERDNAGRIVALWPLLPSQVTPYRDERTLQLRYRVAGKDRDILFKADEILHIPGLGFDGLSGYSPIKMARESLGVLAASERFGATFFGNGATFAGILRHPKQLIGKAPEHLRSAIESLHKGADKAHRFLILEEGMDYTKIGVNPNEAQFLETRKFQITEIARWFKIPPHKLADLERATFSNIEEQNIDYVSGTLRPWLVRWEQEINRKLISPREQTIQYAEHLIEGLLRGKSSERYAAYAVGRQWGWLSADDIREYENQNPLPDGAGKIYLVPTNMAPADRIGDIIDAQVRPAPAPVVAPPADKSEADRTAEFVILNGQLSAQMAQIADLRMQLETEKIATIDRGAEVLRVQRERDEARTALQAQCAESERRAVSWKEAIAERDKAIEWVAHREAERDALQTVYNSNTVDLGKTIDELNAAKAQHEQEAAARTAAEARVAELDAQLASVSEQWSESLAGIAALETDLQTSLHRSESLTAELTQALDAQEQERAQATAAVGELLSSVEAKTAEAAMIAAELDQAREQAVTLASGFEREQDEWAARRYSLEAVIDSLTSTRDYQAEQAIASERALEAKVTEQAALTAKLTETEEALAAAAVERLAAQEAADAATRAQAHAEAEARGAAANAAAADQRAQQAITDKTLAVSEINAAKDQMAMQLTSLITANRGVLVDALNRMIRREADKARSKRVTPAKLRAWVESFYDEHEVETWREGLQPAITLHLALVGSDESPEAVTRALVQAHMDVSRRQLTAIADSDPHEYEQALTKTLLRWETDRAEKVADSFVREEIAHVRSYR
jgi:HK97 family phage portal protein